MSNLEKIYSIPGVVRRRLDTNEWKAVTNLVKARELLIDAECEIRDKVNRLEEANPTCHACGQDSKETKAPHLCKVEIGKAHDAINSALDAFGAKHVAPWDLDDWLQSFEKTASQDGPCQEISKKDEPQYPLKSEEV